MTNESPLLFSLVLLLVMGLMWFAVERFRERFRRRLGCIDLAETTLSVF